MNFNGRDTNMGFEHTDGGKKKLQTASYIKICCQKGPEILSGSKNVAPDPPHTSFLETDSSFHVAAM
jgi:hypothetical protein